MKLLLKTITLTNIFALVALLTLVTVDVSHAEKKTGGSGTSKDGEKCTVASGDHKGKKGTYDDGFCEGDWGATECRRTPASPDIRCKDGHVRVRTLRPSYKINTVTHSSRYLLKRR